MAFSPAVKHLTMNLELTVAYVSNVTHINGSYFFRLINVLNGHTFNDEVEYIEEL